MSAAKSDGKPALDTCQTCSGCIKSLRRRMPRSTSDAPAGKPSATAFLTASEIRI
ncbi:MAG TPA: hypothetical protein VID24_04390 [Candidatus Eremiobacteraceae bacterium]